MDQRQQELVAESIQRTLELEDDTELVEFRMGGKPGSATLRVFIYRAAGVTVEDCTRVSRRLSRELESQEEVQQMFAIEVSSPGLDRKLNSREDFQRALGEVLKVTVTEEGGEERSVRGLLTEVDEGSLLFDPPPERSRSGKADAAGIEPFRIRLDRVVVGKIEVLL
jgi:ribosome maturation factor RimP